MRLAEYLRKDFVLDSLAADGKPEVLAELVAPVARVFPDIDAQKALRVLLDRESLGTTGIGDGVAIPHGKMDSLKEIVIVAGRSTGGVDFEALDHKPCRIFFLVLAPEHVAGMHLRILAQISRLLSDESFRGAFLDAPDQEGLWRVLTSHA
ncbi:PTS sugar transporter subunit IIA [Fundidesulfovibrio agrisoli]|uniref:PTS sugar transporter subunit IIA n=1 Tax=Fundidesulfovibrio agrisoli TaxID=2922717 RepID=UPI001FAE1209|nr:PTS sugar transporter subunit IIA [Fundidesulfovibrio agrisoli]